MLVWPFLTLLAAGITLVPMIGDRGHRSLIYWLIIPPLVAGMMAACANLRMF